MELPNYESMIRHEVLNLMNKAQLKEENGRLKQWEEYQEIKDIFDEYSDSIEQENFEKAREKVDEFGEFLDRDLPEGPKCHLEHELTCLEAGERYRDFVETGEIEGEIDLDNVLKPFEYEENVEIDEGYEELYVEGNEALALVSNTIIKNWHQHGEGYKEEGKMWVDVSEDNEYVNIDIWDNGPGADDYSQELFNPENEEYTGLPVSREITEAAGGSLEVYEPDTGGFGYNWRLKKT